MDSLPVTHGPDIASIQRALISLGYPCPGSGELDTATQAAVRAFQHQVEIVADGVAGAQTKAAIERELAKVNKTMTLHPQGQDAADVDPVRTLGEAVRAARAVSHSRKLDPPIQAAFNAFADAFVAVVDHARVRDEEIAALRKRIWALETRKAT